jgi:hypothetical protein
MDLLSILDILRLEILLSEDLRWSGSELIAMQLYSPEPKSV